MRGLWAAKYGVWHWHERIDKPDGTWFIAQISRCGIGKRSAQELSETRVQDLKYPDRPRIGGYCVRCSRHYANDVRKLKDVQKNSTDDFESDKS